MWTSPCPVIMASDQYKQVGDCSGPIPNLGTIWGSNVTGSLGFKYGAYRVSAIVSKLYTLEYFLNNNLMKWLC